MIVQLKGSDAMNIRVKVLRDFDFSDRSYDDGQIAELEVYTAARFVRDGLVELDFPPSDPMRALIPLQTLMQSGSKYDREAASFLHSKEGPRITKAALARVQARLEKMERHDALRREVLSA